MSVKKYINAMLLTDGAIAQLVERLHGMQEVRGSTPLSSITFQPLRFSARVFL